MKKSFKKYLSFAMVLLVAIALMSGAFVVATLTSETETQNGVKLSAEATTLTSTGTSVTFGYSGGMQSFTTTYAGYYTFDLYGGQGQNSGSHGKGGRAYGTIYLEAGVTLYIFVGGAGSSGGYNGGGQGGSYGGGATDVRTYGASTWYDTTGLRSRIMVAGGGGGHCENNAGSGGYGGGLTGTTASSYDSEGTVHPNHRGGAGGQTYGGSRASCYGCGYSSTPGSGSFGVGGNSGTCSHDRNHWGGSGGGGYYGGGAGMWHAGGGGGSSFVSGLSGCDAVNSSGSHTGQSIHYSGYAFFNAGTSTGVNSGNGYAVVSFNGTIASYKGQNMQMSYTGYGYCYTIPVSGYYQLSCYGAAGGYYTWNATGAYVTGRTFFTKGTKLYVFVGGNGENGGFNGGGAGGDGAYDRYGGGATDFRMTGQYAWNNDTSLKSRILVAGGGGGHNDGASYGGGSYGKAGIYNGYNGFWHSAVGYGYSGLGASQWGGGSAHDSSGYAGGFGYGGSGVRRNNDDTHAGGGGGGGYYGGSGSRWHSGAGGGSSYVNGYSGFCTYYTVPGYSFSNVSWSEGANSGNGVAYIQYIYDTTAPSNATISAGRDLNKYYNSVSCSFSGSSDSESGYNGAITYQYSFDNSSYTTGTSVTVSPTINSGTQTRTLYVRVYDPIGNYSQVSRSFYFDRNTYSIGYSYDSGWSNPNTATSYNVESSTINFSDMSRTGYTFYGWYTDSGKTNKITSIPYQSSGNYTLYAKTAPNNYTVTFDQRSGSGGSGSATATYDAAMPSATMPTRTGYSFAGYFDATSGGTQYYNANGTSARTWNKASNATLYARWNANSYAITFNKQSGSGGTDSTSATYDSAMPTVSAPSRTGYSFQGYYTGTNGSGTKYYNANGTSANTCKISTASTLYAHWTPNNYTLTLDGQSATSQGSASATATYDATLPNITVPTRKGYTFGGYFSGTNGSGTQYYAANGTSSYTWTSPNGSTAYAKWTVNSYTVTFDKQNGLGGTDSTSATYDAAMPGISLPSRSHYTFEGYYSGTNGSGTQYYTREGASVRTWDIDSNTTLYAYWVGYKYKVALSAVDATNQSAYTKQITSEYGAVMPAITLPERTGYTFNGYFLNSDCSGKQYYNGTGGTTNSWDIDNDTTTLYAKWTANTYTIVYNVGAYSSVNSSFSGTTASSTHTYDSAKNITSNGYSLTGYDFMGWSTSDNGQLVTSSDGLYTDAQSVINLSATQGATVNFYAKWKVHSHTVSFNFNSSSGQVGQYTTSVTATFDSSMPSATMPVKTGFNFVGYFDTSATSGGTQYYNANGSSTGTYNKDATSTLYARWSIKQIATPTVSDGASNVIAKVYDSVSHTLTCSASHELSVSYQWLNGSTPIGGATASTYVVKNVADTGYYYCKVSVSSDGQTSSATSTSVVTVVIAPESLTATWSLYNDKYHNSEAIGVEGGSPESGDGSAQNPYLFYWDTNYIGVKSGFTTGTIKDSSGASFTVVDSITNDLNVFGSVNSASGATRLVKNGETIYATTRSTSDSVHQVTLTTSDTNYSLTSNTIYYKVIKRPFEIEFEAVIGTGKEYDYTFDGAGQGVAFRVSSSTLGQTLEFDYDFGSKDASSFKVTEVKNEESGVVVFHMITITSIDAGDYSVKIKLKGDSASRFAFTDMQGNGIDSLSKSYKISPRAISGNASIASLQFESFIYNGSVFEPTPEVTDANIKRMNGDYPDIVLKLQSDFVYDYVNNLNAGTATVKVIGNGNYFGEASTTFTISPKSISDGINVEGIEDAEYNGLFPEPDITIIDTKINDTQLTYQTDYTIECSGDGTVEKGGTVVVIGMGNYTGKTEGMHFNIIRKTITAEVSGDSSFEYDKTVKSMTIVSKGYVSGEEAPVLTVRYDQGCTFVGTYKAYVSLDETTYGNYTMTDREFTMEITQKEMEIEFSGYENLIYDSTVKAVTASFKDGYEVCTNDSVYIQLSYTGNLEPRAVGEYTVNASLNNRNYKLVGDASKTFSIARKKLTTSGVAYTKTFGDSDPGFVIDLTTGTTDGIIKVTATRERVAVGEEGWMNYEKVGTYYFNTVDLTNIDNYDVEFTSDCSLTIDKKSVVYTPGEYSKVYGDDDPDLTQDIASGAFDIILTATFTRTAGQDVGSYNYVAEGTSYTLTFADKTNGDEYLDCFDIAYSSTNYLLKAFKITKKSISITIGDNYKTYGEADSEFKYTVSEEDLAEWDVGSDFETLFNLSISRIKGEDYLSTGYSIDVKYSTNNYSITVYGNRKFMINKFVVTIDEDKPTVVKTEKVYDGKTTAEVIYVGGTNMGALESKAGFTAVATYSSKDITGREIIEEGGSAEGLYTKITITYNVTGYGMAKNFILPSSYTIDGKITPATLVAIPSNITYEYGADKLPTPSIVYEGFIGDEDATIDNFEAPGYNFGELSNRSNAGTYVGSVMLEGGYTPNYIFEYRTGDVEITQAKLVVVEKATYIRRADGTYDANLLPKHYAYKGAKFGDEEHFVLSFSARLENSEPGNTTAIMTIIGINDNNYYVYNKTLAITAILQNSPSITATSAVVDYDGTPKSIEVYASILGEVYDNLIITYSGESYPETTSYPVNAGVYTVKVVANEEDLLNDPHYATLTINKLSPKITISGRSSFTYGEFEDFTATIKLLNETVEVEPTYDFAGNRPNEGLHVVTVVYPETVNYNSATQSVYFNVNAIETTVKFSDFENIVYNGKPQYPMATIVGTLEGDSPYATLILADDITPVNAGTYTVRAISPSTNYTLKGTVTMTYTIHKRTLKVSINEGTQVQAGTNPQLDLIYDGFAEGEDASNLADTPRSNIVGGKVGENLVSLFGGNDSNYEYEYQEGATVEVVYESKSQNSEIGKLTSTAGNTLYIVLGSIGGIAVIVTAIALIVRRKARSAFVKESFNRK